MIIKKGKELQYLKKKLDFCSTVQIDYITYGVYIFAVLPSDLDRMYEHNKDAKGEPTHYCFFSGSNTIRVFPIPDKDYEVRVIGTQLVEQ